MRRLLLAGALLFAGALLLNGCLAAKLVPTAPLVVSPPWTAPETLQYVLLDRDDGNEVGRGTLDVAEDGDRYKLSQKFSNDDGDFDNSVVLVNKETLKPISGTRDRSVDGEEKRLRSEYDVSNPDEEVVTIYEIKDNGDERPVPHRLKSDWYDNDTSLFLWRSFDFTVGLKATYHTVVTGSGEQPIVQVEVIRKESVTVPAGTFSAWRLEIKGQDRKQVAWYADSPGHQLVQYDNSVQFFQLLTKPGS